MRTPERQTVWEKTGGICWYCLRLMKTDAERPISGSIGDQFSIDHRTPKSRGGTEEEANLVPCCVTCNTRKATRTEQEYRDFLLFRGVVPRFYGDKGPIRDWMLIATEITPALRRPWYASAGTMQ